MFNKDISDKLIELYGEEQVALFSEMESIKNELILNDLTSNSFFELNEFSFERDWWKDNAERLKESRFAKRKNITP
jgi:hypothetical protein